MFLGRFKKFQRQLLVSGKCIIFIDNVDSFGTQEVQAMCITEGCVLGLEDYLIHIPQWYTWPGLLGYQMSQLGQKKLYIYQMQVVVFEIFKIG